MPVIEQSVTINRSVAEIFRFVADFSNNPKWQPAGMQLERSGKVRIGDMVVGKQRIMGRMQHVNADVIDYSPNQRITYKGIMGSYSFSTTYDFDFTGAGGTKFKITTDIRIPWWFFMLRPVVASGVRSQVTESLQNLKQFMEDRRDLGT